MKGFYEQVFLYVKLLDIFLLCEDTFLQNAPLIKDFRMQRHLCNVLYKLQFDCRQSRIWCGPAGHQMGVMPEMNGADAFFSALFALQTRMQVSAVAPQFSCLLEKSQDILACIQNSFALIISL